MSTDPVNDKERRILGPKGPFAARATGGPSDASPEPPEARTVATMRLREALDMERATSQGNAMTPLGVAGFIGGPWLDYIAEPYLDAERASHPVAASAAELRDTIFETLMGRGVWEVHLRGGHSTDASKHAAALSDLLSVRLAAAPPRASEPAEAGCQYKCPLTNGGHHGHAAMDADHEFVR